MSRSRFLLYGRSSRFFLLLFDTHFGWLGLVFVGLLEIVGYSRS